MNEWSRADLTAIHDLHINLLNAKSRMDTDQAEIAAEWAYVVIAAAAAAEREAIIAICMEAGDTALANKCGEIAGAMYVTVARIRARAGEKVEVVR